jgi:hypothetical protein
MNGTTAPTKADYLMGHQTKAGLRVKVWLEGTRWHQRYGTIRIVRGALNHILVIDLDERLVLGDGGEPEDEPRELVVLSRWEVLPVNTPAGIALDG